MKPGLAFMVYVSLFSCVVLLSEAKQIKSPYVVVVILLSALPLIISIESMDLGGKGYVGYQVNEDDSFVAPPRMGHHEVLSLGVGHNYPTRKM